MNSKISWTVLLPLLAQFIMSTNCLGASWPIKDGRPVAPITSAFGARCLMNGDYHAGIDVRIFNCNEVVAVAAGTIYRISTYSGYQWSIIIQHGTAPYTWYSGYHHLARESLLVDPIKDMNKAVSKGQVLAKAGPMDHLHFNYWLTTPVEADIDGNTSHPLRLLGASGEFSIHVAYASHPYSALAVVHCGQLLETGVGLGSGPYSYPFWTYVWNYEGNVRSYTTTSGFFEPGDCYLGADANIGISPTSFEADQATTTYFVFPTSAGIWILNNSNYTYALSASGTRITIELPVSDFFQEITANVDDGAVVIEWTVSRDGLSTSEFAVLKGTSRESMNFSNISVSQIGKRSFRAIDAEVEAGTTYW